MLTRINAFTERLHEAARVVGTLLVELFHYLGLFVIGATTVWAAAGTLADLVRKQRAGVEDILLLFIFLEIGAMVGIYFKTNHMPVRFLFYVAITAATRHMIGVLNQSHHPGVELLIIAGSILILALALLCVRYGSYSFPAGPLRQQSFDTDLDATTRPSGVKPKQGSNS
jgi:protein PsiE